jgi:hypothetical protein
MTKLRGFYRSLRLFSTKGQAAMCSDLIDRSHGLADFFADACERNVAHAYLDQPFLPEPSDSRRKSTSRMDCNDNEIYHILHNADQVAVAGFPGGYSFRVIARQVPPLRAPGVGQPDSGKGGIDYVGIAAKSPVLGEIKVGADQNPFYAFVQLLTYLSEMATENQIERCRRHLFKEAEIDESPAFDLHILLANYNDRGEKGPLIQATKKLAESFRSALRAKDGALEARLGNVLCLKLETLRCTETEGMMSQV